MLATAGLTWLLIANAIFTFMIARLDEKKVAREQVIEALTAPDAKPITIEEGKKIQNEDDVKYLPYTANQIYFRPVGSDFNLYPPAKQPGGLSLVNGKGSVTVEKLKIADREFLIETTSPTQARVETYNHPNWIARLDDDEVEIKSETGTGLMLIDVPAGNHKLSLNFEARHLTARDALWISIISWGLLALLFGAQLIRRR